MSPRARRIVIPLGIACLVLGLTTLVLLLRLGVSAFPAGKIIAGHYLVENHGKVVELTAGQYWLSYVLTATTAAAFLLTIFLGALFSATGDIKHEELSPTA